MLSNPTCERLKKQFSLTALKPFGIELIPLNLKTTFQDISAPHLHELMQRYRIIVVRQAQQMTKPALVHCAEQLGPLLPWDFGVVMDMRQQDDAQNYLFTSGAVPFHWDGAFHQEPRYLLFHCLQAPLADCGGETLFSNTHFIWQNATAQQKSDWVHKQIHYKTEKRAHYGGEICITMVQEHPHTHDIILRFAEPVPSIMLNPVEMHIEGFSDDQKEHWLNLLTPALYHKKHCYEHTWQTNDIILADNYSLLHARRAFKAFSPRHLQRIQIL